MTSLLLQREFFQLAAVQGASEVLPFHSVYYRPEYRGIYLGSQRVGFTYNILEALEGEEKGNYTLRHQTYLTFRFLGQEREMLVKGEARLDKGLRLENFDLKISSGDTWTKIKGKTVKTNMDIVIEGKHSAPARQIVPVTGPVFFSEALNFIWTPENLKLGKRSHVMIWNPLLMNIQQLNFFVRQKTKINFEGKDTEVFVVHFDLGGIETRSWITPEGIVVKEESPSGMTFLKEEGYEVFDAMRKIRANLPDLPNLFSIPSSENLGNPGNLVSLKLALKSPSGEERKEITKQDLKSFAAASFPLPPPALEIQPYLAADSWIQTDDPDIQKTAREITKGETSALNAALKIMDWVHANVLPVPSTGLPQAKEVLKAKRGDCNEYTVLFTALARAAGIPAKSLAGLVYQNGRFFYHAWAQVYLDGKWLNLDPTFGQAPVDVTHLALAEGELREQTALIGKLGKTQIRILDKK